MKKRREKIQLEPELLINGIRAHKGADVSSFCNINNHTFTWSNNVEYTLTGSLMRTICNTYYVWLRAISVDMK